MIVSFRHGFVFCAVPRTATHALRAVLRPHLGPDDWEQCRLGEPRAFPLAPLARVGHGHLALAEVRPVVEFLRPGWWEGAVVFAVVRDPAERFVSACRRFYRGPRFAADPLGTMKRTLAEPARRRHFLFRPQADLLYDAEGNLLAGVVCQYERLDADVDGVMARIGLPAGRLPVVNASPPGDAPHVDGELAGMIAAHYADDYRRFGYDAARALPAR